MGQPHQADSQGLRWRVGFTEKTQHVPSPLRELGGKELCTKHIPRRDTHIHTYTRDFFCLLRRIGGYSSRGTIRATDYHDGRSIGRIINRAAGEHRTSREDEHGRIYCIFGGMGMGRIWNQGIGTTCISHFWGFWSFFFSYVYTLPT